MPFLDDMDACYALPSPENVVKFLDEVRRHEDKWKFQLEFWRVKEAQSFPWQPLVMTMNALFEFKNTAHLFLEPQNLTETISGAGWGMSIEDASIHAAAEALERSLFRGCGFRTERKERTAYFSLRQNQVLQAEDDLTRPLWASGPNPFFSRCGEAFHPLRGQALRAAYCEAIEREVVAGFCTGRYTEGCDVSHFCSDDAFVKNGLDWFRANNYEIKLASVLNPFGMHVVVAAARTVISRDFRCAFSGSGADFLLSHATRQAFVELARYAFMGEVVEACSVAETHSLIHSLPASDCMHKVLRLSLPEGVSFLSPFFDAHRVKPPCEKHIAFKKPKESMQSILKADLDIWYIDMHSNQDIFPGYAAKIIVPSFGTECGVLFETQI